MGQEPFAFKSVAKVSCFFISHKEKTNYFKLKLKKKYKKLFISHLQIKKNELINYTVVYYLNNINIF